MEPLRIGLLGAARIAGLSIVSPAAATGHRLVAVAARDEGRARAFADEHGVERVVPDYAALVADPEVEVVYNPLANGLHGRWNLAAVAAGKHVLTEKPSAADAVEARMVAAAVRRGAGTVFMEAFHFPYHPLFRRVVDLVADGAVGEVRHVEAHLGMPAPAEDDPRWRLDLAGGSTMDLGCYALAAVRLLGDLAGGEPEVRAAQARERAGHPGVDETLRADLAYPSGASASASSDMAAPGWDFHLTVSGTEGLLHVPEFPRPHLDDTLVLERRGGEQVEHLGTRSSYTYQLEALAAAVREGAPVVTDANWSVGTMDLVDAAYRAAGMDPRAPARE